MARPEIEEHIFNMATAYFTYPPENEFQQGYLSCLTDLVREFEIMCNPDKDEWVAALEQMLLEHPAIYGGASEGVSLGHGFYLKPYDPITDGPLQVPDALRSRLENNQD